MALEQLTVSKLCETPLRVATSHLSDLLVESDARAARADFSGCHALNEEFHESLVRLSGNQTLLDTYQRLVNELSLFRHQAHAASRNTESLRCSVADHRALYQALVAGDREQAWSVLHRHVETSRQRLRVLLSDQTERLT
jgi:DNA-binding GntR family transcriptional regulator